ncbi:MAG: hypothetical protein XD78_1884, partial [Desulfotomaculum sp. 46_296]
WVYTPYMACAGMYKFTKFMLEIVIKVLCNASDLEGKIWPVKSKK